MVTAAGDCNLETFTYTVEVGDSYPNFKGSCASGYTYTTNCQATPISIPQTDISVSLPENSLCQFLYNLKGEGICNEPYSVTGTIDTCGTLDLGADGVSADFNFNDIPAQV